MCKQPLGLVTILDMAALANCCLATAAAGTAVEAVEQLFAVDTPGNQVGQRLLRQRLHVMWLHNTKP